MFQNQPLEKNRSTLINNQALTLTRFNRHHLPRFCLNLLNSANNVYDISIEFNDIFKTAQTSLFEKSIFNFSLYSYTPGRPYRYINSKKKLNLMKIQSTSISSFKSTGKLSLKSGSYFMEVSIIINPIFPLKKIISSY